MFIIIIITLFKHFNKVGYAELEVQATSQKDSYQRIIQ